MISNRFSQWSRRANRSAAPRLLASYHRMSRVQAASANLTHGTWIIAASVVGLLAIGALAVPASPIHHWVTCQVSAIDQINSTKNSAATCSSTSLTKPTSTTTSASIESDPFYMNVYDNYTGIGHLLYWSGTRWSLLETSSNSTSSVSLLYGGAGNYVIGATNNSQSSPVVWNPTTEQWSGIGYSGGPNPSLAISPQGYIATNANGGIYYTQINSTSFSASPWTTLTASESGSNGLDGPLAINPNNADIATTEATTSSSGAFESHHVVIVNPNNPKAPIFAPLFPGHRTPGPTTATFDPQFHNDLLIAGINYLWYWNGTANGTWSSIPLPAGITLISQIIAVPGTGTVVLVNSPQSGAPLMETLNVSSLSTGSPSYHTVPIPTGYTFNESTSPVVYESNGDAVVTLYKNGSLSSSATWVWNGSSWNTFPALPYTPSALTPSEDYLFENMFQTTWY